MAENSNTTRTVRRPAMKGKTHRYIVADDVHEWIIQHGGGQYITDTMRSIMAVMQEDK